MEICVCEIAVIYEISGVLVLISNFFILKISKFTLTTDLESVAVKN